MSNKRTIEELRYYQSLPLDIKISLTKDRIRVRVSSGKARGR